uniref:Protein transport protein Sec31A n=1 Tax=Gorilla gorilla gorilla TaxID=9595 RepID=G3R7K0_GORGO
MKLKEVDRTAMQAWSPAQNHPIYLATGTSAQQLDATFSTNASLEIFELDLSDPSLDMKSCATFSSSHRYHKLIWGPYKMDSKGDVSGVLIAGGENGNIILYDPSKIIAGDKEVVIAQNDKHTGPVRALDVNIFQTNLVASGANESEIYIWDLNNFATPMTPGAKTQPPEDISCIAWNRQVQHILASASPSGRATVWDLRKNEPIIKVSDHSNRGILAIAWSMADPELLLSCGKDAKILCSNPNTGEFGGKLVTFENVRMPSHQGAEQQQQQHHVFISQVVTEKEFLSRSDQLQQAVQSQGFISYCQKKIDASQTEFEKNVWSFLKVNFEDDSRGKYLELLGYRKEDLGKKIALALNKVDGANVALKDSDQVAQSDGEESPAAEEQLLGEHIKEEKEESEFLPSSGGTFNISISGDIDGLITQALLTGNFESAVDLCLHDNRMADAIILAIAGGQELLARTQKKYFAKSQSKITRLITAVVMKNWKEIVESCDLKNWREALAAVLTYAKPDEFSALCDLLGTRLENEGDSLLQTQACLCYICAGNVEKLVACWTKAQDGSHPLSLQDLIEKVVILRKAVQLTQAMDTSTVGVLLAAKMSQYANLLAAQGSIAAALAFLPDNTNQPNIMQLRDRLCRAQGEPVAGHESPKIPYEKQQLPKGRPGPVAGHHQMPRVQTQQYYPHVRIAPTVTTWSNKTPTALPSHPPAASPSDTQGENPPPPGFIMHGNVNPNAAGQLPTSPGHMHTQVPPYPQPQPYQPAQPYPFGTGGSAMYRPQQPVAPPTSNTYPNTPYISSASSYTGQSQLYAAQHQASSPTSSPATSFPPPPSSGASFQHGGPGAPPSSSAYALPPGTTGTLPAASELPASQRTGPQNGWNDPPALNRVPKKKKMPENFMPPVPITSPIMNPLGDPQSQMLQQQPSAPVPLSSQSSFPQPHLPGGQPFHGIQQPLGQTGMPPSFSKPNIEGAPGAPIGNTFQHVQSLPTKKITKKPIPDEHLVLKTTFEDLIQRCLSSATDPQTKRKLDDASKRLEFLYDKLREQTLSPTITSGLHNIARSIETRNYSEGLTMHTHIVSTSNFSETSAFMPVLKVVLTQANKLGV